MAIIDVNTYGAAIAYTKKAVKDIEGFSILYVQELPTTDIKTNALYLVPNGESEESNLCDEYVNSDGTTSGWEKIGSTEVDLSAYALKTDLPADENFLSPTNLSLDNLDNLRYALKEQNLKKYGFKIGDYFTISGRNYYLAQCEGIIQGYYSIRLLVKMNYLDTWAKPTQTDTSAGARDSQVWSTLASFQNNTMPLDLKSVFGNPGSTNWLFMNVSGYTSFTYDSGDATPASTTIACAPLSETEVFGTTVFARKTTTNLPLYNRQTPLAMFRQNGPGGLSSFWLRDIVDETHACRTGGSIPSYDSIDARSSIVGQFIIGFKA